MARKKKVVAQESPEPVEPVVQPVEQEGEKDPYSEGKHMENPEPNNNAANRPEEGAEEAFDSPFNPGVAAPHDSPNADEDEQNAVAEGRVE